MGMDMFAETWSVLPMGMPWHEWKFLREVLVDLGADVSSMAKENGGDLVDEATASDWGRRLMDAADQHYFGAEDHDWFLSLARFFILSGGFRQF
jgi:hypothetical protein